MQMHINLGPANNQSLVIPPRSNYRLQIKTYETINHIVITIKKQELNEHVIIAISINPITSGIKICEQSFEID